MRTLPIVDISDLYGVNKTAKATVIEELGQVFHDYGFAGIQGHLLPSKLITQVREQVVALFDLPDKEKLKLRISPNNYRGYIPLRFFTPNAEKHEADNYEGYKLHFEVDVSDPICAQCDLYGANKWPIDLPDLATRIGEYWQHCDRITGCLLHALAKHLSLNATTFDAAFSQPLTNMTLLRYPTTDPQDDDFGIHPHKDTDALTILAPDKIGGLFLKPRGASEWIEATVPDETLIVNVGDMLETWSNGYFISTPHKVENKSGLERYSFPYFAVPRYDTVIEPMVPNGSPMPSLGTAGEISRKIWHSNWPDAPPIEQVLDPYSK